MRKRNLVFSGISLIFLIAFSLIAFTDILISPPLLQLVDPNKGFWSELYFSQLESSKVIKDPSLSSDVRVVFDIYGIPHIFASNLKDAYFALGYIHARERLWQMDMFRRFAEGRLSEILGRDALEIDIFTRVIGLPYYANLTLQELKSNSSLRLYYDYLDAYSRGVNKFIDEIGDRLPLMFKLLNYRPEHWTPFDSIAFAYLMSWDLTGNFDDLYFYEIAQKLGFEKFDEIFPIYRPYTENITIVRKWPVRDGGYESLDLYSLEKMPIFDEKLAIMFDNVLDKIVGLRKKIGEIGLIDPLFGGGDYFNLGSNNWALAGEKTYSGKPILCSDPHLSINLPLFWYIVHIYVPGLTNIIGVTFPAAPPVIIGYNSWIAWGLTNTQADVVDFYYYKVSGGKYLYKGSWRDFDKRIEKIRVRGEGVVKVVINSTVHGPVISSDVSGFDYVVAMKWIGHRVVLNLVTLFKLNVAKNYNDFVEALKYWSVPAQNFVYADVYGNIAIWSAGLYPVREFGAGRVPYNGSAGEGEWVEYVPFNEIPHELNPVRNFVASANQRPYPRNYPYYLGIEWDPSGRARRIYEVLSKLDQATLEDMKELQNDYYEVWAEKFVPTLVSELNKVDLEDQLLEQAKDVLANWNYLMDKNLVAPTIWYYWFETYRDYIWLDEWKAAGIRTDYTWGHNGLNRYQPPVEYTLYITLEEPNSIWFDNVSTPNIIENRSFIMVKSFKDAIEKIKRDLGDNINDWIWGKINKLYVEHLSGLKELSRGPFSLSGGFDTVNSWGAGTFGGGAGWRMIVDFSDLNKSLIIIAGGQSGHILSKHYDDLLKIYIKGEYINIKMYTNPEKIPKELIEASWIFKPQ